ncbi:MAG: hypothetical protein KBF59_09700 [Ignavibacterium sp.]|jgi:hypothetical protein|nr:hypothetical protein [Ignavibacterium sp.]
MSVQKRFSGAAEEILGRIAKKRTKTNQLDGEVIYLRSIYDYFSGQKPSDKGYKSFYK